MNASKESVKAALEKMAKVSKFEEQTSAWWAELKKDLDFIHNVLEACEKKLPSELSYQREKERKRKYAMGRKGLEPTDVISD